MNIFDSDKVIDSIQAGRAAPGAISVITLLEVLRGVDEERRQRVKELLEKNYVVQGMDNAVILLTCRLYNQLKRDGERIEEADLIIAATAMAQDSTLITGDANFRRLTKYGLRLGEG